MSPPPPQVDRKLAGFSGIWVGEWNTFGIRGMTRVNHVLAVERIHPNDALILDAWGESPVVPEDTRFRPGWVRGLARFVNGTMVFTSASGAAVTYTLNSDGTINGVSVRSWVAHMTLRRVGNRVAEE